MRFLYDNIVVVQVALVCSAFAWLFGGTVGSALTPTIPWLLAILLEFMLVFPQRHSGETTYEARARVWGKIGRDPLTWISIAFILLLMVPFFNKALCPCCDYPLIHFDGKSDSAPVAFIPFCINRAEHLSVVMWFVPSLTAMLAVKHSLLKRGKRLLLELIVWNGLLLSFIGILQSVTGAPGPLWVEFPGTRAYFFSTFGYPNMGGDYFTTLFCLSVALWRWNVAEIRRDASSRDGDGVARPSRTLFWRRHLMLVPAVIFFFSALMTLSRASILLSVSLAILFYVHALTCALKLMDREHRVKAAAKNIFALIAIATLFFVFMSDRIRGQIANGTDRNAVDASASESPDFRDDLEREVKSVDIVGILDRLSGQGQYHTQVACRVWKDYPFFGCGGWGYRHLCIPKMTDDEYKQLQKVGGINVHNDLLQFMVEHGAVGLLLLVAIVVLLVKPIGRVWKVLVESVRFLKPRDQPPRPISVFALPAPVFCILMAAVSTLVHSFADCPMRSPAVLSLFLVELAAIDGFLPRVREK